MPVEMSITEAGLKKRLEDGRWHPASPNVFNWFSQDPKYEIELKYMGQKWFDGRTLERPNRPNMRCRVKLKLEHVQEPFRSELEPK